MRMIRKMMENWRLLLYKLCKSVDAGNESQIGDGDSSSGKLWMLRKENRLRNCLIFIKVIFNQNFLPYNGPGELSRLAGQENIIIEMRNLCIFGPAHYCYYFVNGKWKFIFIFCWWLGKIGNWIAIINDNDHFFNQLYNANRLLVSSANRAIFTH